MSPAVLFSAAQLTFGFSHHGHLGEEAKKILLLREVEQTGLRNVARIL